MHLHLHLHLHIRLLLFVFPSYFSISNSIKLAHARRKTQEEAETEEERNTDPLPLRKTPTPRNSKLQSPKTLAQRAKGKGVDEVDSALAALGLPPLSSSPFFFPSVLSNTKGEQRSPGTIAKDLSNAAGF